MYNKWMRFHGTVFKYVFHFDVDEVSVKGRKKFFGSNEFKDSVEMRQFTHFKGSFPSVKYVPYKREELL